MIGAGSFDLSALVLGHFVGHAGPPDIEFDQTYILAPWCWV